MLVTEDDAAFVGGTYVMVQKYLHDLHAWQAKPVEQRELAVGRRMLDDVELDAATKPADSHSALTTIEEPDGREREILRDNMRSGRWPAASTAPTSSATPPTRPSRS